MSPLMAASVSLAMVRLSTTRVTRFPLIETHTRYFLSRPKAAHNWSRISRQARCWYSSWCNRYESPWLTPSCWLTQIPLCTSCAPVHKNPSLSGQKHHKPMVDNMPILLDLSRIIPRREEQEKGLETEWGSGGRRFKSSRPDHNKSIIKASYRILPGLAFLAFSQGLLR